MTDRPKQRPDDETIAQWVREMPAVEADAGFRDRLRSAFTSGAIDADERMAERAPRRRWWGWVVPAVAAAVVVFALNRGPALEVLEVTGAGSVVVDGQAVDPTAAGALARALRAGAEVSVPAGMTLDLLAAGSTV